MLSVDILTPVRTLAKDLKAKSLIVPTESGEINILPEHTHIITKLDTGILTVTDPQGHNTFFSMTTGILKLINNKVTLLCAVSESPDDIDEQRAKNALNTADGYLKQGKFENESEFIKYQRKLDRARVRIQLIKLIKNL